MLATLVLNPNGSLKKVKNCLCPDGSRRVATITGLPDNWFSTPARVKVKGKSVSGYVTCRDENIKFIPYLYRKNASMFESPLP